MKGAARKNGRPFGAADFAARHFPGGAGGAGIGAGAPAGIPPGAGIAPGGRTGPGIAGAEAPPFMTLDAGRFPAK